MLLTLAFSFFLQFVSAQNFSSLNPQKQPSQYILNAWSTEQGLSSESTNDLIQGSNGYIWIGTYTGLHRFDGNSISIFNTQNSGLPSPNILRMDIDTAGTLWLGTLHGVCKYENGVFSIPEMMTEVNGYSIETIRTTKSGDIWFSTKSNHIFKFSNNTLTELTKNFNVKKNTVLTIADSPDGTIYIGTDDSRLYSYYQGEIRQLFFNETVNGVFKIIASSRNVYIGTGKGLFKYENNKVVRIPVLENTTVNALVEDQYGSIWMGTMRGLFRYNPEKNKLDSLTEKHGLPNNIIRSICFDTEGNLWGGTYRKGFFMLSDGSITSFSKSDGLTSNVITAITQIEGGKFLLGDESGNLNLFSNGQISPYKEIISLPKARLKHLFTDSQNRVWVSTYGGLVLHEGKNSKLFSTDNGFPDNFVRNVFQDKNGKIWIGTKNAGLIKFNSENDWEIISSENGMSSNYIMSIEENSKGQLIIGTISGINILENGKVIKTIMLEDGLPSNFAFSTYSTDKFLWIASNDGLTGYSEEKIVRFNTENGLPSNIVYDIIADNSGNLWMPSEKSILKVSLKELEETASVPGSKIKVEQYDKSYGMKNNHCLGGVHSYKDNEGKLWIPTQGGVALVNTKELVANTLNAKTIIEKIVADNDLVPHSDVANISSKTNRLVIEFTGIDYKNSDKIQFRYKLEPFDKEWILTRQERKALYTNLPPGNYRFLLQTGINDKFLAPTLVKEIHIQAAWWQTMWARIFFVLVFLFAGLLIYIVSVRALRSQNRRLENMVGVRTQELEAQKKELTDTLEELSNAQEKVIQSEKMASLGVLAAGVAHEINNPLNFIQGGYIGLKEYFEEEKLENTDDIPLLLNSINEGIERAVTIVASLNEFSHQTEERLTECNIHHIIDNCLVMLQHNLKGRIEIVKDYDRIAPIVNGNSGKLHQALLNIITNAEHSIEGKGKIFIKTRVEDEKMTVEIKDTGVGIDSENLIRITDPFFTTKEPGKGTGLGLSITYAIVNEHKGILSFSSKKDQGTIVAMQLPLIGNKGII